MPPFPQSYNDEYRGWPVSRQQQQHPMRGTFLDPGRTRSSARSTTRESTWRCGRTGRRREHLRTDAPRLRDRGRPRRGGDPSRRRRKRPRRSLRLRARRRARQDRRPREGGADDRLDDPGPLARPPDRIPLGRRRAAVAGQSASARRKARAVHRHRGAERLRGRFYSPATPKWGRRVTGVAQLPHAGTRLDKTRLAGIVDLRARMSDPQSFIGWFSDHPDLAAPHHPYRLGLLLIQQPSERVVLRRTVYIALQQLPIATAQHYAPGTKQNLPDQPAVERRISGAGEYWFRL